MIITGNLVCGRYAQDFKKGLKYDAISTGGESPEVGMREVVPGNDDNVNLHKILSCVLPWLSSTQGFSRAIAQLLVYQLIPLVIHVNQNVDGNESDGGQQGSNIWYLVNLWQFLNDNPEMARMRKKQTKFFHNYHVENVCTLNGILQVPVDLGDEANPIHMVDAMKKSLEELYGESHGKISEVLGDKDVPMWKLFRNAAETNIGRNGNDIENGGDEDDEEKNDNDVQFQRKIMPLDSLGLALEEMKEASRNNATGQRKQDLIVCASLIDKIPNLAGLARTAEIFAAQKLIVPDLRVQKMDNFKSISVGANEWITIEECPERDLLDWLLKRKEECYTIVGIEQTSSSGCISDYKFPKKTVLLLGKEREGIPIEFLHVVDVCVEIPQLGIIRSLNVHVSGAISIWEYSKQQMVKNQK